MVVKPCSSVVSLTMECTSWTVLAKTMLVQVSQGDSDTSTGRRVRCSMKISRIMFMRGVFSLNVIEEPVVLGERRSGPPP